MPTIKIELPDYDTSNDPRLNAFFTMKQGKGGAVEFSVVAHEEGCEFKVDRESLVELRDALTALLGNKETNDGPVPILGDMPATKKDIERLEAALMRMGVAAGLGPIDIAGALLTNTRRVNAVLYPNRFPLNPPRRR